MAKLPDNFVKPPAASQITLGKVTAGKAVRRARKAELPPESELAADAHSVLVRLSAEEHQALSAACDALAAIGQPVSIEDMIKQVILRWITATRAMQAPSLPAPPQPAQLPMAPIRAQLRKLAAEPIRRWQELGRTLRRWSRVFEARVS